MPLVALTAKPDRPRLAHQQAGATASSGGVGGGGYASQMSEEPDAVPESNDDVELISDGENLLVVGNDRRAVEGFMRSTRLLDRAREISARQLVPILRSAAEVTHTVAESVAESGLWVKLTEESASAIKDFGLTETDVPGVAYAMAGNRGDIKQWLKINTSVSAKLTNPALLSGVAGGLAQAASQAEAEQLRALLESLDEKLDQVLRGQRDEVIGRLAGVERHLGASQSVLRVQGEIDTQEWDMLAGTPLRIREVQSTAVEKLRGVAADMEKHRRVGDLNTHMPGFKQQVQLWVGVIARCVTALDEFSALELEHTAVIAPSKLDAKRLAIQDDRRVAITELATGVADLMGQMAESAELANKNRLLHRTKVPKVLGMIEDSRGTIKSLYDALGMRIDWDALTAEQWRAALLELEQWKNALTEGGAVTWEKGKPVLKGLAIAGATALLGMLLNKGTAGNNRNSEA